MVEITLRSEKVSRILVEPGLLGRLSVESLFAPATAAFVVTDENVSSLYLETAVTQLESAGSRVHSHAFPPGEDAKSPDCLQLLWGEFSECGLDRSSLVAALGGGTVGDLAGFAAATYMRGTRFVQIPTTLLAQVDAGIGGKVAVNHLGLKNLVGTFYQPEAVVIDPRLLRTLPETEIRNGFAEIVKAAVIGDDALFEIMETTEVLPALPDEEMLVEIISRAIRVKVNVVEQDERENGLRRSLNFGHTIGHAMEESAELGEIPHGAAVSAGMALEARLAVRLSLAPPELAQRIENLVRRLGFPYHVGQASPEGIVELLKKDKKTQKGELVFALPRELGRVEIVEGVKPADVLAVLMEAKE